MQYIITIDWTFQSKVLNGSQLLKYYLQYDINKKIGGGGGLGQKWKKVSASRGS